MKNTIRSRIRTLEESNDAIKTLINQAHLDVEEAIDQRRFCYADSGLEQITKYIEMMRSNLDLRATLIRKS